MSVRMLRGDCRTILPTLPANSVHCVVTSPPYAMTSNRIIADGPLFADVAD